MKKSIKWSIVSLIVPMLVLLLFVVSQAEFSTEVTLDPAQYSAGIVTVSGKLPTGVTEMTILVCKKDHYPNPEDSQIVYIDQQTLSAPNSNMQWDAGTRTFSISFKIANAVPGTTYSIAVGGNTVTKIGYQELTIPIPEATATPTKAPVTPTPTPTPTPDTTSIMLDDTDSGIGYYDSKNVKYDRATMGGSGTWYAATRPEYLEGKLAVSREIGAYFTYTFNGIGIGILSEINTFGGRMNIYIDGNLISENYDSYSTTQSYQQIIWDSTSYITLDPTEPHTLKVVAVGPAAGQTASNMRLRCDGLKIYLDPNPTPTEEPLPPTATPTNAPVPPSPTATPTNAPVPPSPTATPTIAPVPPSPTATPTIAPVPPSPTATPTNAPVPPSPTATSTIAPVPPSPTPTAGSDIPPTPTPTKVPVVVSPTPPKAPFNTAKEIGENTEYQGEIKVAGAYDYYKFTATQDGTYHIYSTGTTNVFGRLYDSGLTLIASDDDSKGDKQFEIVKELVAGETYYVAVRGYASVLGKYGLVIQGPTEEGATPAPTNAPAPATATPIKAPFNTATDMAENTEANFAITVAGAYNYHKFTATVSGQYHIYSTGSTNVFGRLYDSNLTLMASDDDSKGNKQFEIVKELVAGETYYVAVRGYGSVTGPYGLVILAPGSGELPAPTLAPTAAPTPPPVKAPFNTATAMLENTTYADSITVAGAYNYYSFVAAKTGTYTIESIGTTNVFGRLYNSSTTLVASDDDSAGNKQFRITYDLVAGQTYYIAIRGYGSVTGPYSMKINPPAM